ncbi:hypothetical protein VAPA_1c07510 [Variovorax paradoxus B4]|uniref:Uncharacterized protein n=1 Tax=Variovorax paradoxus B4 TaxID=1246301 RepID=T1X6T1_VARPD|nr:hypothetical protein VAPA_1c07510 [Variovorax paradoxus B4]
MTLAAARRKARAEAEKRAEGVDPREARRVEEERNRVARLNAVGAGRNLTAGAVHTAREQLAELVRIHYPYHPRVGLDAEVLGRSRSGEEL